MKRKFWKIERKYAIVRRYDSMIMATYSSLTVAMWELKTTFGANRYDSVYNYEIVLLKQEDRKKSERIENKRKTIIRRKNKGNKVVLSVMYSSRLYPIFGCIDRLLIYLQDKEGNTIQTKEIGLKDFVKYRLIFESQEEALNWVAEKLKDFCGCEGYEKLESCLCWYASRSALEAEKMENNRFVRFREDYY